MNTKKFVAVAAVAFAFAFAAVASAATWDFGSVTLKRGQASAFNSNLQTALNACMNAGLTVDGVFGANTEAKVKMFQQSKNLVADGLVGNNTKTALNNCGQVGTSPAPCPAGYVCTPNGGSSNGGSNSGEAGDINSISVLGSPSGESVGEGEDDVKVLGFEVEADNGSDINLTSVKIEFDHAGGVEIANSSDHLDDYISEVSIWMGSKQVGSADVEDFSETDDGVYSKNISLSNATVGSDDKERFYVAVSANSTVDSGDFGEEWSASLESTRFTDGTGAILTDSTSVSKVFKLESFADASDLKMKLSLASDSPDAQVVEVDSTSDTDGVELLKFKIKAEGSEINIDQIPVRFTVTGTADDVTDVSTSVTLMVDGDDFDDFSETVPVDDGTDTTLVTFDDLGLTIDEGDTMEFTVTADINDLSTDFVAGDTIQAEITSTERDLIDAEDAEGDNLDSSDRSGSAIGEEQSFYENGLMFTLVSTSAAVTTVGDASATTPTSDVGTFTIKYKLTAFGTDVSVDKDCLENGSETADDGVSYIITNAGSNSTVCSVSSTADTNTADSNAWIVEDGQSETFTLTVAATASADHFAKVYLESINYDDNTADTSPDQFFTSDLGEDTTSTNEIYLNDN